MVFKLICQILSCRTENWKLKGRVQNLVLERREYRMKIFFNVIAIVLLTVLIICAIFYWTTGEYYSISGVALILFIITVAARKKYKKE